MDEFRETYVTHMHWAEIISENSAIHLLHGAAEENHIQTSVNCVTALHALYEIFRDY